MNILEILWADIKKILAFAPVIAAVDPNAAAGLATASATVTALQPVVEAVHAASDGTMDHQQLVDKVTSTVAASSAELAKLGIVGNTTDQHVQAIAPMISAAVALSGLAATEATPVDKIGNLQVRG